MGSVCVAFQNGMGRLMFQSVSIYLFLYNRFNNMIVFYPFCLFVPSKSQHLEFSTNEPNLSPTPSQKSTQFQQIPNLKENEQKFFEIFQNELKAKKKRKKLWNSSEDQLLLKLRNQGKDWNQIAQIILEANPQKCKRRFNHIKSQVKRWPKFIDDTIKQLYQEKSYSWSVIAYILNKKLNKKNQLNSKQVKERYLFHLKPGITNKQWTVEEDMLLLRLVLENGNVWKTIAHWFPDRTELQLKNRYYGTLKFIQKRVLRKLCEKDCLSE